jgi:hypothetical protein
LRTLFSYAKAPFEMIPILKQSVLTQTAETLRLNSGVVLAAYPCRPAAVRGLRAQVVIADELAFFRSTENLPQDVEMLRALRPTLATTNGKLIILSSPYGQAVALWDLHRKHFGREESSVLVWQASAPEMNPTLSTDYLARMEQDDPESYRSEVLGQFRAGLSTFLDPDAIAACVDDGIQERAPLQTSRRPLYVAFADPSGGRHDRFAVAIAHRDGELCVLDAIRAWTPPFNPSGVLAEAAELLKAYRCTSVMGDRYAAEFVAEQFRSQGISYTASELDRSALYLELLPLINAGRARLLDHAELLRELRGLERHRGSSGRDRVDHGPHGRDDIANAVAGALHLGGHASAFDNITDYFRLVLTQASQETTPPPVKASPTSSVDHELERTYWDIQQQFANQRRRCPECKEPVLAGHHVQQGADTFHPDCWQARERKARGW